MKTTTGDCAKCFKHRKVLLVTGPGLNKCGVELCRSCHQAYKDAIRREVKRRAGMQAKPATAPEASRATRAILRHSRRT